MDSKPEKPLREVFLKAAEIEDSQARSTYLDEACAGDEQLRRRVETLLAAEAEAGTPPATQPSAPADGDLGFGRRIGDYKLLQQIGEGGCGVVFMAEQEQPVRRKVALKVIKLGMDTKQVVARFEAERQALAMMDHPNIAKVFEAGMTEGRARHSVRAGVEPSESGAQGTDAPYLSAGRPYFVMELVRGIKITDYCDEQGLSTRQRLGLFLQVCYAVQHAHQKGIIHRDLKPSNVLVTEVDGRPLPKVIDFGIAKAVEGRLTDKTLFTAFEQLVGTPAYMSPEQASLSTADIDTRSDIYSLGVLLYELLTGQPPFDQQDLLSRGLDEMRRTIREREPAPPSNQLGTLAANDIARIARVRASEPLGLVRHIRGDLDWIVLKCLEKARDRRYQAASQLARDIEAHLHNRPILARPITASDRVWRWCRRNPAVSALSAALVLCFLILAIAGPMAAMHQSRLRADAEFALRASQPLDQATLESLGDPGDALRILSRALRRWPDQPQLWIVRGLLLERSQQTEEGTTSLGRAIELLKNRPDLSDAYLSEALLTRSRLLQQSGRFAEAGEDHCRALNIPVREAQALPTSIDLSLFYDAPLTESLHLVKGRQGNDLSEVPSGLQLVEGFPNLQFDVRGVVSLNGGKLNRSLVGTTSPDTVTGIIPDQARPVLSPLFRVEVTGIRVGGRFTRMRCLMATGWWEREGETIGKYVLHYANHESVELPIRYGVHVRDVLAQPDLPDDEAPLSSGKIVWRGMNAHAKSVNSYFRLYVATWINPHPDHEVVTIDFVSTMTDCAPFLVAMTVEP